MDETGSLYTASEEVGKSVGPLLLSFTGAGAVIKGKAVVDILKTIVKIGKRPKSDGGNGRGTNGITVTVY